MRKSNSMRLAALLLALTMMTTCFVGGTFAKYTASVETIDEARIAYWGFDASTETELGLFDFDDTGILQGDVNLIAPGSGKTVTFKTVSAKDNTKAPEVKYAAHFNLLTYNIPQAMLEPQSPIRWTFECNGQSYTDLNFNQLKTLIERLDGTGDEFINGKRGWTVYEPGKLMASGLMYPVTIGWTWAFEGDDAYDTTIGNMEGLYSNGDIKFILTVDVVQIDE